MQHVGVCQASVHISYNLEEVIMSLYKVTHAELDNNVVYLAKRVFVYVTASGRYSIERVNKSRRTWLLENAAFFGTIDTVTKTEAKMFWLVFGPTLRAMGVIK